MRLPGRVYGAHNIRIAEGDAAAGQQVQVQVIQLWPCVGVKEGFGQD